MKWASWRGVFPGCRSRERASCWLTCAQSAAVWGFGSTQKRPRRGAARVLLRSGWSQSAPRFLSASRRVWLGCSLTPRFPGSRVPGTVISRGECTSLCLRASIYFPVCRSVVIGCTSLCLRASVPLPVLSIRRRRVRLSLSPTFNSFSCRPVVVGGYKDPSLVESSTLC